MKHDELLLYTDYLLRLAMSKCDTQSDAEDLVQDTMLAALNYIMKGNEIEYPKTWLANVLMNRYNTNLRKKYRQPYVVSYESLSVDVMDDEDKLAVFEQTDEAVTLRSELTYLTQMYRSVVIRYYVRGYSVAEIAEQLGIPQGTVKSRLDSGRKQIKKGMEKMNNINEKELYAPKNLGLSWTGSLGDNRRPISLIENDKITQNILLIAYDKPMTDTEIARTIGIPTVYIEPIIERLVDEELMVKTESGKVYTDFIIYQDEDRALYLDEQIDFVKANFASFRVCIEALLEKIRNTEFSKTLNTRQRTKMERFWIMEMLAKFDLRAGKRIFGDVNNITDGCPYRKYGGKWIAIGNCWPDEYVACEKVREASRFGYAGHRITGDTVLFNTKDNAYLHEYDTAIWDHGNRYVFFGGIEDFSYTSKFLYAVYKELDFEEVSIKSSVIEKIPDIIECTGLLAKDGDKLKVDIAVMNSDIYNDYDKMASDVTDMCVGLLEDIYCNYLETVKMKIPSHIKSILPPHLYSQGKNYITMAVVMEACEQKVHLHDVDYCCPPAVLVIN